MTGEEGVHGFHGFGRGTGGGLPRKKRQNYTERDGGTEGFGWADAKLLKTRILGKPLMTLMTLIREYEARLPYWIPFV